MKLLKRATSVALAALLLSSLFAMSAPAAHADRCQPYELVFGPGTSPVDEADDPTCYVLINYVYGFICDDKTTLARCRQTLGLNPGYRPTYVPYQPKVGRIYCGIYTWVVGGTCTSFKVTPNGIAP